MVRQKRENLAGLPQVLVVSASFTQIQKPPRGWAESVARKIENSPVLTCTCPITLLQLISASSSRRSLGEYFRVIYRREKQRLLHKSSISCTAISQLPILKNASHSWRKPLDVFRCRLTATSVMSRKTIC